jgi:hypothetical protein
LICLSGLSDGIVRCMGSQSSLRQSIRLDAYPFWQGDDLRMWHPDHMPVWRLLK